MQTIKKTVVLKGLHLWIYSALVALGLAATAGFGVWWFEPSHIAHNFSSFPLHLLDILLFAVLTYVVWFEIVSELFSWAVAFWMRLPVPMTPEKELRVALVTAFVPGKEPYDVLENTLRAMKAADYPHHTWLLDEGDDTQAKRLCERYEVRHYSRHGQKHYNQPIGPYKAKTKGGNYNSWFDQYSDQYDIVAQHDVDFMPHKNFLTKTLGYFRDPEVAFVGTPQIYGNTEESWIVRGAAEQAYSFYGHMQKGFFGHDMQLFIGANHVIRVTAHNDIDGYAGHIVEDHLTGMKLYAKKWKSVYVPEILAVGEGPSTWSAYFSQQMRWAYGLIDIFLKESPKLFPKMRLKHVINYFCLQQYYFYGFAQVLGIGLLSSYFLFGIETTTMSLRGLLSIYPIVVIMQILIFLWLQQYNVDPKKESGLFLYAKFLNFAAWPVYFMAFMGVLTGKRLTYAVTPKGKNQQDDTKLSMFYPHLIMGSITLIDIIVSFFVHRQAPQLLFWASVNTLTMYYFFFSIVVKKFVSYLNKKLVILEN